MYMLCFNEWVDYVAALDHFCVTLYDMQSMNEQPQMLYLRLFLRAGPWFKLNSLSFSECSDIHATAIELEESGLAKNVERVEVSERKSLVACMKILEIQTVLAALDLQPKKEPKSRPPNKAQLVELLENALEDPSKVLIFSVGPWTDIIYNVDLILSYSSLCSQSTIQFESSEKQLTAAASSPLLLSSLLWPKTSHRFDRHRTDHSYCMVPWLVLNWYYCQKDNLAGRLLETTWLADYLSSCKYNLYSQIRALIEIFHCELLMNL